MDRVWDPRGQRRSGAYVKLVQRVCKEPRDDIEEMRAENRATFLLALKVLATDKVVTYVTAFLDKYKVT